MHCHEVDQLNKISKFAAIAFATAAVERVLPVAQGYRDVETLLNTMLDELWQWQSADKPHGKENMTIKDAEALPSARFYFTYQSRLLELVGAYADQGQLEDLLGAAIANISFIVWLMDKYERVSNPGKPIVLGSDIAEVDWGILASGLETAANAANDPEEEFRWQSQALVRLAKDHPGSPDPTQFGAPVTREYFFEA